MQTTGGRDQCGRGLSKSNVGAFASEVFLDFCCLVFSSLALVLVLWRGSGCSQARLEFVKGTFVQLNGCVLGLAFNVLSERCPSPSTSNVKPFDSVFCPRSLVRPTMPSSPSTPAPQTLSTLPLASKCITPPILPLPIRC